LRSWGIGSSEGRILLVMGLLLVFGSGSLHQPGRVRLGIKVIEPDPKARFADCQLLVRAGGEGGREGLPNRSATVWGLCPNAKKITSAVSASLPSPRGCIILPRGDRRFKWHCVRKVRSRLTSRKGDALSSCHRPTWIERRCAIWSSKQTAALYPPEE